MTSIVLDTCSIINLHHGGVLGTILDLSGYTFAVGPSVLDECAGDLRPVLQRHIDERALTLLDDEVLPATLFATLLQRFRLGEGETECLAFAQLHDLDLCTDDRAARRAAGGLLGRNRVTGSPGLLRACVEQGRVTVVEAMSSYQRMRAAGAFLPRITAEFFRGNAEP